MFLGTIWCFEYVKIVLKFLETFLTFKIGILRLNFISSRSENFRVFYYIIWWTEYEKNFEKNHWGILDLENLQSGSLFIFWINESWRWLSSVIHALKIEKIVKKNPRSIFDLELVIFKVNGVCGDFYTIFYIFSAWNYIRNTLSNFHDKCGADRYIDQQLGWGLYLIYPVILCINFAFYKTSICTEISPQLKG